MKIFAIFAFWVLLVILTTYGFGTSFHFITPLLNFISSLSLPWRIVIGLTFALLFALGIVIYGISVLSKAAVNKTGSFFSEVWEK